MSTHSIGARSASAGIGRIDRESVPDQATIHPTVHGGFVFNASTIFWSFGLSSPPGHMPVWSHNTRPPGPDERVQRMTDNLLRRAIDRQRPIAAPPVRGPPRQCLRRGVGAATLKRCSATGVWPASATR
ncbi:MAG: hypothetical protein GXY25_22880 [Pirellulaceae bacterium]|nr:hypothetical protein [Thermoguttaceae bacterium]MDI9443553.1 hypothetical protein [Planctomycetota bacterium]NLZ03368.1 hypothetical protein [Pirellulaceae bacterium]